MPARVLAGAMCVQRFDDSLNSAIHITYRISLRSSSMPEPRDPLLKVLTCFFNFNSDVPLRYSKSLVCAPPAGARLRPGPGAPPRGLPPKQLTIGKVHKGFKSS